MVGGEGADAGYNGMLLPLDISCNKSYSIAGPGSACSRSLSCFARCKHSSGSSYFCNGADIQSCADRCNYCRLLWVGKGGAGPGKTSFCHFKYSCGIPNL